jgi:hypothetical protein
VPRHPTPLSTTFSAPATQLLDAVRVGLGLEPGRHPAPISAVLVELAASHRVLHQVVLAAPTLGTRPGAEAAIDDAVRQDAMAGLRTSVTTRQVVDHLTHAGVRALVIKGAALAAQTGRTPVERRSGDVDLLIRPEDWLVAHDTLVGAGFEPDEVFWPPIGDDVRSRVLRWTYYEKSYRGPGSAVDLHWRLTPGRPPGLDTGAVIRRAVTVEVNGAALLTLDPDTALAHTALHAAKDGWVRLGATVDAFLLVEVSGASWDRAASLVPGSPAIAEARAGVGILTGDAPAATEDAATARWVEGLERRAVTSEQGRPDGGWLRHLRRVCALTPDARSAAAILASHVVSPPSMARSPLPPSLWWLEVAARRPLRVLRVAAFGRGRDQP